MDPQLFILGMCVGFIIAIAGIFAGDLLRRFFNL